MVKNYVFINANEFLLDSFKLAKLVYTNFIPDLIIGIWRGGSLITFAIDEYFRFKNLKIPCYPLKSEAYSENRLNKEIKLFGLNDLSKEIKKDSKILLVDDVLDTGSSLKKIIDTINSITKNIKIATIYYKPEKNKTDLKPDFCLHVTNSWIVFPHEIESLTLEEIKEKNSLIHELLFLKSITIL
jgi:hypoxanthine phosphoribosyltransferase